MSSITFLVSAVLTVCVLHAVDQNGLSPSINKINFNSQAEVDVNKKLNVSLVKPAKTHIASPDAGKFSTKTSARTFSIKKGDHLMPLSNEDLKKVATTQNSAL